MRPEAKHGRNEATNFKNRCTVRSKSVINKIGMIGSGKVGSAIRRGLTKAGIEARIFVGNGGMTGFKYVR